MKVHSKSEKISANNKKVDKITHFIELVDTDADEGYNSDVKQLPVTFITHGMGIKPPRQRRNE